MHKIVISAIMDFFLFLPLFFFFLAECGEGKMMNIEILLQLPQMASFRGKKAVFHSSG